MVEGYRYQRYVLLIILLLPTIALFCASFTNAWGWFSQEGETEFLTAEKLCEACRAVFYSLNEQIDDGEYDGVVLNDILYSVCKPEKNEALTLFKFKPEVMAHSCKRFLELYNGSEYIRRAITARGLDGAESRMCDNACKDIDYVPPTKATLEHHSIETAEL